MASSAASPRPIKGILKKKGGASEPPGLGPPPPHHHPDHPNHNAAGAAGEDDLSKKSQKWDEMNILATYHPADKDYGLMKIDEPSTPYHSMIGDNDEDAVSDSESNEALTPDLLAKKLAAAEGTEPKFLVQEEESSEEDEELSPEEQEKKRQFEMKRKLHYNEGLNIKLARQLISKELHGGVEDEDEEEDDDEEMQEAADVESMNTEASHQIPTASDQLQKRAPDL
ncbi:protein phosphatase inhibitor 2 [Ornithorhynchus anatinus]|uniref:Protein phosphatase 1 regulatory inhibitor subunit 2 n=1 Tax=Ornithorhynchus anatinus TaxID=9258 RepID=A0A6I8PAB7_ORNAN|nr:protein phosphatase inhibitor 2 [Ornithorhynchus anatinus]